MRTFFILHGTDGSPQENWFPWLKQKLEDKGNNVIVPQFPNQQNDSLEARLKKLNKFRKYINKNTILIGHSRGGLFLLRILEKLNQPVFAAFFVSGSVGIKPYAFYESGFKFAHGYDFDWEKIKSISQHFFVYHSNNDPYTSIDNGKMIANKLGVKLTFIPDAGHFNSRSGYTKFDKILSDIQGIYYEKTHLD